MKKGVWLSLLLMIMGTAMSARTFYVATDGSDKNPGSKMEPLRTIQKAAGAALAGDTILVRSDNLVWSGRVGDHGEEREQIRRAAAHISSVHTTNAQDTQWMKTGVWTTYLRNRQVMPETIRRLGPKGTFYQPMMHPNGTFVVFWGREDGTKGFDLWSSAVDGSQCRRLTSDGRSEGPSWSPDKKNRTRK